MRSLTVAVAGAALAAMAAAQTVPVAQIFQSLSPVSAAPGTAVTLTIYGAGIAQGATVNFKVKGLTCSPTVVPPVTSRKITATIPSSCTANAGTASVSVTNPGTIASNVVFFWIARKGVPSYTPSPGSPIAVGTYPKAVVVADFNNDGNMDLAIANGGPGKSAGNVTLLLGDGAGNFTPAQLSPFPAGSYPYALVAGDFNGDGNMDLAVANEGYTQNLPGQVSILLGNGHGAFARQVQYATGALPYAIIAADFNGDGKLDLATANYAIIGGGTNPQGSVTILTGNGDGTFQEIATPCTGGVNCSSYVISLAAGDFNNDGILDLAVLGWNQGNSQLALLKGAGNGTFTGNPVVNLGSDVTAFVVGNFDGDASGNLDVAFAANGTPSGPVTVLLGNGAGTLSAGPACKSLGCSTPAFPNALAMGDFNIDGLLDIASATGNFPAGNVAGVEAASVFQNSSTAPGSFINRVDTSVTGASLPSAIATGDFNNDGKPDLVVVNTYSSATAATAPGSVTVLLHN